MEHSVVGRDDPLRRIERFIDDVAHAPRGLAIEGLPGIGKTTVWRAGVDLALQRGHHVLVSRPSQAETALSYSGLADLLADVDRSAVDVLPAPQRRAIDVALLVEEPAGPAPEPRTVFAALGGVFRSLAEAQPIVVAIDDYQWLDRSSAKAMDYVVRRLGDATVGLLAAVRPPARFEWTDLEVVTLESLSPAALHRIVDERLGVSLPRATVLRLHRTTDGNPFFALEVARALVAAGLPGADEPWPVPDDLQDMVTVRVRRLPWTIRSALLTAAARSHSTIDELPAASVQGAVEAEFVTVAEHGRIRFAHPLIAAAVYRDATAQERRNAHATLAAGSTDVEEQARHRALATDGPDEEVAELLDQAAAQALSRGAPDIAAELQHRAVALTPLDQPARSSARAVSTAENYLRTGEPERARELLLYEVEAARGPTHSRALRLLGEACYRLRYLDEAITHLRNAIVAAASDAAASARAQLDLMYVLIYSFGSFLDAQSASADAVAAATSLGDNALLAGALAGHALATQLLSGHKDGAMLERALALEDVDQPVPVEQRPSFIAGWALLMNDELDRAREVFDSLRERLVERGADSDLPDLLAVLSHLESLAGNFARAAELADDGYELSRQEGSDTLAATTRAMRASAAAFAGRPIEARAAAAAAIELAATTGWQVAAFWATSALAQLELASGNDATVVTLLAHSLALVEEDGIREPARRRFLPDAIEALVGVGELARAERLTDELEERGRTLNRPWATVAGARCRALLLAARGEIEPALRHLTTTLDRTNAPPMPLEVARTLIVKGQLERRRKKRGAAAVSLREALAICEQIGAELWAERARAELARTGRARSDDELTPSEARVAELAAAGLTNREIAATAFMSPKTVEANLSRVYRKLGIRSRAELGLTLASGTARPASRGPETPE